MATGFSPNPRGGWIITITFPKRRPASTMSPWSVYSPPGGSPQCSRTDACSGAVGAARHPQRRGRELGLGEPLGVLAAGLDQLVDQRVPILGELVLVGTVAQ